MGFNECVEPFTSNVYKRKTLAGEFILVNKHLVGDLVGLGLWSEAMRDRIVAAEGSVQHIPEIPQEIKELYKTVWEIKQRALIDMAADRGPYVCQSQSMNLFLESPEVAKLSSMHFYTWKKGLKTGMYYLRSKPKAKTQVHAGPAPEPGEHCHRRVGARVHDGGGVHHVL
jgi:ribonucleoside-diphosphate reductase alpha chain